MTVSGVRQSESLINLIPALIDLSSDLKSVQKSGVNTFQRYKYASLEDYFESVTPEILQKHGFFIVSSVAESTRLETIAKIEKGEKTDKVTRAVEVRLTTRLLHKSGEWLEVDSLGEGNDSGDKAVYKAITGARKYGVALLLRLVTTDDPEKDEKEVKPMQPPQKKPASAAPPITETIKAGIREYKDRISACEKVDEIKETLNEAATRYKQYAEFVELREHATVVKEVLLKKNAVQV